MIGVYSIQTGVGLEIGRVPAGECAVEKGGFEKTYILTIDTSAQYGVY